MPTSDNRKIESEVIFSQVFRKEEIISPLYSLVLVPVPRVNWNFLSDDNRPGNRNGRPWEEEDFFLSRYKRNLTPRISLLTSRISGISNIIGTNCYCYGQITSVFSFCFCRFGRFLLKCRNCLLAPSVMTCAIFTLYCLTIPESLFPKNKWTL